ncbi:vWA domain-containing protein [Methylobacter tundripaludum]|uniref:von Willebrand factor type A n=1 Tax=Methylobacter tundripaludum (strain ATCC BAA-1195 / DSM 17260 / SV96) TaxID=697282 RepID=G3IWN1_METTV|nr:VWA domain-containing protein [Methylobacter tundripaludum]EGW23090.1 von Willebrand factor type A [Methylobacter tundripaludum SV96]
MNLAEFHFIRPYWLLAVLPYLPILVLMLRNKLSQGNWSAVCDAALLPYLLQEKAVNQSRWPITAGAIAALLAIIALAGPTWERLPSPVFRNDSALVIALDLSRSMDAADIKPSRLIMARYKIADILKQRKDGQTALLVYAGDAFTVTPLTDDTETIDSQLSALNTDIMPSQGSNTASALEKAVELLKQAGLQKGRILLVTDGVDMDKTLAAVKTLDKYQLSILGVGTDDGAPIALPEGGFLKDERGNIVVPKLNSSDLEKLAQAGNGVYQTITANDADIQTVLASMDRSARQQGKQNDNLLLDQWADKGPWLLLLALPLAALTFRKGLLCFALLLILPLPKNSYALGWQDLWQTKDQQAQQAYKKQDYAKAAEQFGNPDWKAAAQYKAGEYDKALESLKSSKSASGAYNQGNALAKAGQLEEAIKAYEKALAINPNDADAKHNKEVVEKELEKQKQEQKKQDQQKKDDKQQSKGDSEKNKEGEQSEKSDEQKQSEQKPEQKPEQKQSDQQQSEEKQQQDKAEEKKPEAEKPQQAEQGKDDAKKQDKQQAPGKAEPTDEQQQANEQWLKRIPDDPAGLLKRKFKYQYGQRGRQESGDTGGW